MYRLLLSAGGYWNKGITTVKKWIFEENLLRQASFWSGEGIIDLEIHSTQHLARGLRWQSSYLGKHSI